MSPIDLHGHTHDGPEAAALAPWTCPACAVENSGPLQLGCVACGSGKPGRHVGIERPVVPAARQQWQPPPIAASQSAFTEWLASRDGQNALISSENVVVLQAAFQAGWKAAQVQTLRLAPPVTADVSRLAPEGKATRTVIAALELFRDQVLTAAEEEIASGEWCSVAEVDQLIQEFKERSDD